MQDILTHIADGVLTLTINRVEKKNSFTPAMYAAMADGLEQAKNDPAICVTVIQGDITVFSAGNDIGDFLQRKPSTQESSAPCGGVAGDASWCLRIFLILEAEGPLMLPCTGLSVLVLSAGWPEGSTTIQRSIGNSVHSHRRQRRWRERSPVATAFAFNPRARMPPTRSGSRSRCQRRWCFSRMAPVAPSSSAARRSNFGAPLRATWSPAGGSVAF